MKKIIKVLKNFPKLQHNHLNPSLNKWINEQYINKDQSFLETKQTNKQANKNPATILLGCQNPKMPWRTVLLFHRWTSALLQQDISP